MIGGVLTTVGQEQVYLLGKRLAARYQHNLKLIGNYFNEKDIQLVHCDYCDLKYYRHNFAASKCGTEKDWISTGPGSPKFLSFHYAGL